MNFEHLLKKKKISLFLYKLKLQEYHRQKLKLGSLVFEIKEHTLMGFTIYEVIDIRYTRQDNTFEDSLKIDNRLKALNWKWDIYNILAFILVISFIVIFIYSQLYLWFFENLPFLFENDTKRQNLVKYVFDSSFRNNLSLFKNFNNVNLWLNNLLFNVCDYYNILK